MFEKLDRGLTLAVGAGVAGGATALLGVDGGSGAPTNCLNLENMVRSPKESRDAL